MSEKTKENGEQQRSKFAVMVRKAANLAEHDWSDERIAVVQRTIAPQEAGAAEVAMFLAVAGRYGLDPFAKEIWLAKDKGRLIILTGKDSILKVARSQPDYLGHESDVVYEKDEFQAIHEDGDVWIIHKINGFGRGAIVGAYCLARKEDQPPQFVMRPWSEYQHLQHKDNWKNYPADMILSRVVTAAHRLLYSISGMYTPEEVDSGEAAESLASHEVAKKTEDRLERLKQKVAGTKQEAGPEEEVQDADFEIVQEEKAAEASEPAQSAGADAQQSEYERLRGRFWALYKETGYSTDDMAQEEERKDWLEGHFGKRSFGHLSTDEIRVAVGLLEEGRGPDEPGAEPEPEPAPVGADDDEGLPPKPGAGLPL